MRGEGGERVLGRGGWRAGNMFGDQAIISSTKSTMKVKRRVTRTRRPVIG